MYNFVLKKIVYFMKNICPFYVNVSPLPGGLGQHQIKARTRASSPRWEKGKQMMMIEIWDV